MVTEQTNVTQFSPTSGFESEPESESESELGGGDNGTGDCGCGGWVSIGVVGGNRNTGRTGDRMPYYDSESCL
jgi:hypothetical protein